jgi:predicted nucleic acid-binding protein
LAEAPVINASPLIHVTRAGYPELLQVVGERIAVPQPVADEILAKGKDDVTARALDALPWLDVVSVPEIPAAMAAWDLGAGESSVIAWAISHPGTVVIIDDLQGRRCALSLGLRLIGTLGMVLVAKRQGAIPRARPIVDELVAHGMYLSPHIIDQALALVGE